MITNTPDNLDTTGKSVYSSSEFINRYANFRINVNAELNYDAKLVNYNLNGGIGAISPTAIGEAITLMKPSRGGYNFVGWATTASATTAEYRSGDIYNGNVTTLYAVWEEIETLYNTVEETVASYLLADDGDARIVSGSAEDVINNYIWYSGKLWRIVALNNDGSIKLVTDEQITAISWGSNTTYSGSWMYQWLNEDFKDTLYNYENLLVTDYKWNATETTATTKPANTTMVEGTVGSLNVYEYVQSYSKLGTDSTAYGAGYLNNGYCWWLITPYDSSRVRDVLYNGSILNHDPESYLYGVHPSINLKSNIEISCTECDGSKTKPYTIAGDITNPTENELINNRVSGEYVTFDNELYRIVSIEDNITKITKVDYLRDSSNTVLTKYFASTRTYGSSGNTKDDKYWDYYLNNTWYNNISTDYKNMIVSGKWYLGTVTDTSYKNAICTIYNTTETTKSCTKGGSYSGYVGLGRIGEMFTSQLGEGHSGSTDIWTITPYDSSEVRFIWYSGYAGRTAPDSYLFGARPSINLKSDIKITGGLGTKESPFEILKLDDPIGPITPVNELLSDIVENNFTLTNEDSDGTRFVTGTDVTNYVSYSGILWRIVEINSDGTIKLVTQDNVTDLSWDSSGGLDYSTSSIRTYLNNNFLSTLNSDLIVDSVWDYSPNSSYSTKPSGTNTITEKVGLLTAYEFIQTGAESGYLLNNSYWWTLTVTGTSMMSTPYVIYPNGEIYSDEPSTFSSYANGVRPSVVLKSGINVVEGLGTADSPYILEDDAS